MATSGNDSAFPNLAQTPGSVPGRDYTGLTKREYFAVHLFEGVIAKLSVNCSLQDKANYAVEASDALIKALSASSGD
jgi:hypothetical protein